MTVSRASLVLDGGRAVRLAATLPQRWSRPAAAGDGFVEVIHQVAGDGLFGGERHVTRIDAGRASRAVVRGIAATALRGPGPSGLFTRVSVTGGSTLLHLPGALLPHRGSCSSHGLRVDVEPGSRALIASVVLAGRTGMGEEGAFAALRLRTVLRHGRCLAFAEDALFEPAGESMRAAPVLAGAAAAVSVFALGAWEPASLGWWEGRLDAPGLVAGVAPLGQVGAGVRGLAATLGDALAFVTGLEQAVRLVARTGQASYGQCCPR